ncbi:S41 family peptidase [Fodinicola feengrottensis]|uniref:S41 family peptidase n=1 Tax=Fodinicola feengrottensis TaxID=435914 RepID=UPI002441E282|nr:S41 family peptidase [Fodinicola feengrottensis]
MSTPLELSTAVTKDLQSINQDRHLRLKFHEDEIPDLPSDEMGMNLMAREAAVTMNGIGRVGLLDGNVAHLALRPVLFPPTIAGPAITAAMQLVASADALILDVRDLRGGDPETVALICGYLFDESTHLITMYEREGDRTTQFWSAPYVPGARFGGTKPIFVLTSSTTFSGGEELSYDLQQHGRATLIGERTGGGAHPRVGFRLHPHLEATVPTARGVSPVSGTNWEGIGVIPDVEVPASDALRVAHERALS